MLPRNSVEQNLTCTRAWIGDWSGVNRGALKEVWHVTKKTEVKRDAGPAFAIEEKNEVLNKALTIYSAPEYLVWPTHAPEQKKDSL